MSKRKRRSREDVKPVDEQNPTLSGAAASVNQDGPQIALYGMAFEEFESIIDAQLDALVNRWIHLAAPAASTLRRVIPHETRRRSGQA